jgi:hypothetical protein
LLVDVVDLAGTSAATALGHLDGLGVDGALVLVPQASPGLADDVVLAHEVVAGADVDAAVAGLRVLVTRVEGRIEG